MDGRWHWRVCSERTGGISSADGAAWTLVAEGGEPPAAREGVLEADELLGISSTRIAPGGEENSSDPTMIGNNHAAHKINQLH